jgi:hypothetical protein
MLKCIDGMKGFNAGEEQNCRAANGEPITKSSAQKRFN